MKTDKVKEVVVLIESVINCDNAVADIHNQVHDLAHDMNKIIAGMDWKDIKPIVIEAGEEIAAWYSGLQFKLLSLFVAASFADTEEGGKFARDTAKILCEKLFGEYTASHRAALSKNLSDGQKAKRAGGRKKGKKKVDLLAAAVKAFEALSPADKAKFLKALK
jgi:hypothetical protein